MLPVIAPVKSKRELVQVALKMRAGDPSMVGSPEPGLKVSDDLMNPGQYLTCPPGVTLHSGTVAVFEDVQTPVSRQGIGVDLAARSHASFDKLLQSLVCQIRQDFHPNPAGVVSPVFYGDPDRNLRFDAPANDPATSSSALRTANIGVVHLHDTLERLPERVDHGPTQAPAQIQSRPVGTDPQLAHELPGGDPGRQGAHEIRRPEPVTEGQVAVLENRSRRDPDIPTTLPASPSARTDFPSRLASAPKTPEAFRPSHQSQVFDAGFFRGEPPLEFAESPRKLGVTLGCAISTHGQAVLSFQVASSA